MSIQYLTDESLESVVGGTGTPANGQLWASLQVPAAPFAPVGDISNKQQYSTALLGILFS